MSENKKTLSFITTIGEVITPLIFILAGGAAWSYFKITAPVMELSTPIRETSIVEVQKADITDRRTVITVMGTVVAAREVTLKAQVSGVVQSVSDHFIPGGIVSKGSELIKLDPSDYEVSLEKAKSSLEDAKASLDIERGSQNIAREELTLLSDLSDAKISHTDLALRRPQLQQAKAEVTSAKADLKQAQLNLERAVVKAPFNAMVISRDVNIGSYVGSQESLVTLVGIDEFWVEAVVPLDQLPLIDLNYPGGSPVVIRSQSGDGKWRGTVVKVAGKLNDSSRMATVIVSVKDPLGMNGVSTATDPLLVNDYVYADITGCELTDVIELPRSALQDNNTVWVKDKDSLNIREVTLAWKNSDRIYLAGGVEPGEDVVLSSLSTPVQGMSIMTSDEQNSERAVEVSAEPAAADSIKKEKRDVR